MRHRDRGTRWSPVTAETPGVGWRAVLMQARLAAEPSIECPQPVAGDQDHHRVGARWPSAQVDFDVARALEVVESSNDVTALQEISHVLDSHGLAGDAGGGRRRYEPTDESAAEREG